MSDKSKSRSEKCSTECCCFPKSAVQADADASPNTTTAYKYPHQQTGIIFYGTLIHSASLAKVEILESHYIGIRVQMQGGATRLQSPNEVEKYEIWKNIRDHRGRGVIAFVTADKKKLPTDGIWANAKTVNLGKKFLIPGFVDCHTHAPQYSFTGTGRIPLLQWLQKYTFPTEAKFKNLDHASKQYPKAVKKHLHAGTTTCCYYATINTAASLILCDALHDLGQRGFVGKVCMDRNSPDYYIEDTETSLRDSELFVQAVLKRNNHLVKPIVTPRFVPSCSSKLMHGLGTQAKKFNVGIQSHLSENREEIEWVKQLHPDSETYAEVYHKHGLLTDRTVMAHCVHLTDKEIDLIQQNGAGVAHCPNSNFSLYSGVMDATKLISKGIKVGLGTDVAGGYSLSILDAIRKAIVAASTHDFREAENAQNRADDGEDRKKRQKTAAANETVDFRPTLDYQEGFFLATQGGADCCGLGDVVGDFKVGKDFDALVIDPHVLNGPFDVEADTDTISDIFQKFIFCGDDRNITQVWVSGNLVVDKGVFLGDKFLVSRSTGLRLDQFDSV